MTLEQIQMVQASFAKIAPIVGPATDRKLRRCSALVAGFRKETRLFDGRIEEPRPIGGSGHTLRRELLWQLVEQLGCKYSAGHLATRPRNCLYPVRMNAELTRQLGDRPVPPTAATTTPSL